MTQCKYVLCINTGKKKEIVREYAKSFGFESSGTLNTAVESKMRARQVVKMVRADRRA